MYRYTTGVVYSVSIWLTIRPPMMAMPSGRRSSEPVPVPKASGTAPNNAAMVVMRIGRKRSMHASKIASAVFLPPLALGLQRKIDHHDGVLLHDADQQHDADDGNDIQVLPNSMSASIAPTLAGGRLEMMVSGMHQALIEDAEHDVDGQQRRQHQHGLGARSDCWYASSVPAKKPLDRGRHAEPLLHLSDAQRRLAQARHSGARLNEVVTEGNRPV